MIKLLTRSESRNFQRLWWGQLISQFGDRVHQMALVALVAERAHGSTLMLAKLMACTIIPVFFIQPIAGVLVDRWDRRMTLLICDIARGILVLLIPLVFIFWKTLVPIYILVFLVFCFSRFYQPAKMSIIPDLVEEDHLLTANSLVSTTGMIAFVLGCALGGILVDRYGARVGFMVDAATFFISGAFVFSIDISRRLKVSRVLLWKAGREIVGPIRKTILGELKEGLQYLFRQKELRFVIGMIFTLLAAAGAVYVVIIVFVQEAFGSVTKDLGVLAVCLGAGLFLGAILYGRLGKKSPWYKTMFLGLVAGGLMLAVFAGMVQYYPHLPTAMFLSFLLGVMIGPVFIAANTVIHLVSEDGMRGKVFSALEIVIHFAFLASMLLSSWLSEFIAKAWILIGVGVVFVCVGLYGFWMKPKFAELSSR